MAMTIEQQKALAVAKARQRAQAAPPQPEAAPQNDIAARAAAMSPDEKQMYRIKNRDPLAEYLMQEVQQPKQGETPEQTQQRLAYGSGKPLQDPSKLVSGVAGAADTLTFGAGDEMAAGLAALTGNRSYADNLDDQRRLQSTLRDANPKSYLAGQIGGAVLPALVTGGGSSAPTLGGRMAAGSAMGAAQGGLYGFNSGEGDIQDRAKNAGINAIIGAFTGGVAPVVGKVAGSAWNSVAGYLQKRGITGQAHDTILNMLKGSNLTPQQAMQRLNDLGPDAMLADIAPGMQTAAGGTALQNPQAQTLMAERLANRRDAGQVRMWGALDNAFGPANDPYLVQQAGKTAKAAVAPEYGAAIANAPALPKSVQELTMQGLTDPTIGKSLANRSAMLGHMNEIDDALAGQTPQDVASRLLDYRKRLDAMIVYDPREKAMLQPAERALQDVHKQARAYVDEILKDRIPGIAEADAKFAPIAKQQAAYDMGRRDILKGGTETMTPAELQARLKTMTPAETDMAKQGVRTEIDRLTSNARREPSGVIDRITSRDWNGEKLRTLVGNAPADKLAKEIDREGTFLSTSNLVEPGRGSRTAVIEAAKKYWGGGATDLGDAFTNGALATSGTGSLTAGAAVAGGTMGRKLMARVVDAFRKPSEGKVAAVADLLTQTGAQRDAIVKQIAQQFLSGAKSAKQADQISRVAQVLLGPAWLPISAASQNNR